MFDLPDYVDYALKKLNSKGYEAYIVGGCVRDFMLGKVPHDFDVTTNAVPEEIRECFNDHKIISTGEKHGTLTVIIDEVQIEITTYRIDGEYNDNRHPERVSFSKELCDDLKRRDFTVNAMALDASGKLTDIFGGVEDLHNKIIRTVGEPDKRFSEDALRILRALRFASKLDFSMDEKTNDAIHRYAGLLRNISAERIREEFVKILTGNNAEKILREYCDVIEIFIPEIKKLYGFEQHSPYHKYDVWEHTIHAVGAAVNEKNIRTAMFFHDIAKPDCFTMDENGRGHFKGHAVKSAETACKILKRMRFSKKDINDITCIICHHSDELNSKAEIKRLINKIGVKNFFDLINVQRADSMSKQEFCCERLKKSDFQESTARQIIENNECYSLKNLAVNGLDLMELGICGKEVGSILECLLEQVITENLENDRNILMNYIKSLK